VTQVAFTIAVVVAWYIVSGLMLALISLAPGALLDRETGQPKCLERHVWVAVVLAWPWFWAAWTYNTWVRR
jgi:hypothetical protein